MNSALCFLLVVVAAIAAADAAPAKLGAYNVNISDSSVSGLSAGAYMATQMQVAYSSVFRGAGIFAGGPYNCAQGNLNTALYTCMKTTFGTPDVQADISTTKSRGSSGEVDDPSNMQQHKVYMYSGENDKTVTRPVMDALQQYYEAFIPSSAILYETGIDSGHTQPTNISTNGPCGVTMSPYVSYCKYDGAGIALSHIYGDLTQPTASATSGDMIEFDQTEFLRGDSMGSTGYVYVPKACASGTLCRLHLALHGCKQMQSQIGNAYIEGSGYNQWADANDIIVLYPQAEESTLNPQNPNGCWNWWGYNNDAKTYDTQSGSQVQALFSMMKRVASNFSPIASPTGLVATAANTSVTLSWNAVDGASAYSVQRNHQVVTKDPLKSTTYTDTDLSTGTTYVYDVVALTAAGASSAPAEVSVTTGGPPPPLTAPQQLTVVSISADNVTLTWSPVGGANGYNVHRNGSLVTAMPVDAETFTDSGLQAETTYSYAVAGVDASGAEGPASSAVLATTSSSWQCQDFYDNNYNQVQAGRAYTDAGLCYAVGSNDDMGLWNVATYTNLAETAPGYYEVGKC